MVNIDEPQTCYDSEEVMEVTDLRKSLATALQWNQENDTDIAPSYCTVLLQVIVQLGEWAMQKRETANVWTQHVRVHAKMHMYKACLKVFCQNCFLRNQWTFKVNWYCYKIFIFSTDFFFLLFFLKACVQVIDVAILK